MGPLRDGHAGDGVERAAVRRRSCPRDVLGFGPADLGSQRRSSDSAAATTTSAAPAATFRSSRHDATSAATAAGTSRYDNDSPGATLPLRGPERDH